VAAVPIASETRIKKKVRFRKSKLLFGIVALTQATSNRTAPDYEKLTM
jgi:hypothetical protein